VDDAAREPALVDRFQRDPDAVRQGPPPAANQDWREEQMAFVDEARPEGLSG
jgi:hypothetical protein